MDDVILKGYIQIKCSNPGRLKRKVCSSINTLFKCGVNCAEMEGYPLESTYITQDQSSARNNIMGFKENIHSSQDSIKTFPCNGGRYRDHIQANLAIFLIQSNLSPSINPPNTLLLVYSFPSTLQHL